MSWPRDRVRYGRNVQVERQWTVLKFIAKHHRATIGELAEYCHVSEKCIRRDLVALEEVGFPVTWKTTGDELLQFIRLAPSFAALMATLPEARL